MNLDWLRVRRNDALCYVLWVSTNASRAEAAWWLWDDSRADEDIYSLCLLGMVNGPLELLLGRKVDIDRNEHLKLVRTYVPWRTP